MKKVLFVLLTSLFTMAAFAKTAPDIIITDEEEKLEVKILKLTEEEVSYKLMDNLEGPEFVVGLDKIVTILYANGDVQNFNEPGAYPVMPIQAAPEPDLLSPVDGGYMLGDRFMNKAQYEEFLKTNCPQAYARWMNTNKYWKVGSAFLGVGIPCIVASIITGVIGTHQYIDAGSPVDPEGKPVFSKSMEDLATAAAVTGVVGGAFTAAAIPIMIVNGIKRSNTYNVYNQQCLDPKPAAVLNLTAGADGVGLALQF